MPFFSVAQNDRIFVEEGDKIYNFGDYEDAILFYQLAIEENPANFRAHYMAGKCFLITTAEKKEAVHYLLKAYELNEEVSNDILFKIAEGYRYRYEFDLAIDYYNKYINEIQVNSRAYEGLDVNKLEKKANRRILECENAKKYVQSPVDFKAINSGSVVNSSAEDYAPTLNSDETTMYFTSRREGSTGGFKDTDNKYFEDIWVVNKVDGQWGEPQNMGSNINTNQHESNIGLSPDGNTLYIYHTENNGDIYYSEKKGEEWSEIESMGSDVNTEHQETSIYQSSNGSYMFFTSSRPGGEGGLDIYVMKKTKKDKWSKPKNLGGVINTEYSEEGPYFQLETSTLYFSSKGHAGMGGYDLYKSVWDTIQNTWSEPENLGYPVNSADDESFYTMSVYGKHAYYASFKEDSFGYLDIYLIAPNEEEVIEETIEEVIVEKLIEEEIKEVLPVIETVLVPVQINVLAKDVDTKQAILGFNVKVFGDDKEVVLHTAADVNSFGFSLVNEEHSDLILVVDAEGYMFQSRNVNMKLFDTVEVNELIVYLSRQAKFSPKVLRNIYFSFDKFSLKDNSFLELDQLVQMLKSNERMKVEIAGHADFKGSEIYNINLSQKRANSVVGYLVGKGIDKGRLTAVGYGEKYPLASNDDEIDGRALNRRIEFVILSE